MSTCKFKHIKCKVLHNYNVFALISIIIYIIMHKYFFIYLKKSKWLRTTGFIQAFIYLFQHWHVCKKKRGIEKE